MDKFASALSTHIKNATNKFQQYDNDLSLVIICSSKLIKLISVLPKHF